MLVQKAALQNHVESQFQIVLLLMKTSKQDRPTYVYWLRRACKSESLNRETWMVVLETIERIIALI